MLLMLWVLNLSICTFWNGLDIKRVLNLSICTVCNRLDVKRVLNLSICTFCNGLDIKKCQLVSGIPLPRYICSVERNKIKRL